MAFTQNSAEYQNLVDQFLKAKAAGTDVTGLQKQANTNLTNNYKSVNIGGKNYDMAYANDPKNQEEIRQAVVNGNNKVSVMDFKGNSFDNITGQQINMQPQVQQSQQPSIADMIRQQSESNKASIAAQLQKTRDLAVSGYNQKIGGLQGAYQPLRDSQDFQGAKNVNATNEQMANMGITNSGDAITAQIQNRVGNENALNSLNQQQQSDKTNFENLIANANNAYNSDLTSSNAGIDAQALNQLITQSNADRSFNYNASRDTIGDNRYNAETSYNQGRDVVADNRYNDTTAYNRNQDVIQNGINEAGITGMYNGVQTMQGANNAAQLKYQNLVNAGYPAEQAAKLAGMTLNNTAQSIQNQYLPQQLQASINSANRANANSGLGSGLSASAQGKADATSIKNEAYAQFEDAMGKGHGSQWVESNKSDIIRTLGSTVYYDMQKRASTTENHTKEVINAHANNYNMQPQ